MRDASRVGLTLVALVLAAAPALAQDLRPAAELALASHLPRDPVLAWVGNVGSGAEVYDGVVGMLRKVVPEGERAELEEGLAELDARLGLSLRDDLLAHLGPELALSVDLPPVDSAVAAVMTQAPGSVATVLGKVGLWVQVRDRARVDTALRTLTSRAGLLATDEGGVVRLRAPLEEGAGEPPFEVFYSTDGGVLVVGFAADRVKAMRRPAEPAERLAVGSDFQRVASHLDRGAKSIAYVNLPRLQQLLRESQMVQGMISSQEEAKGFAQVLFDPAMAPTGWGASTVAVDGGVRQVSYGPSWTSGGVTTLGVIAAVAMPNLMQATSRGKQKRTMADIRTLATATESYAVDYGVYPDTDRQWLDASAFGEVLTPTYLRTLPATDGWGSPLRVWSDGQRYVIVSPGADGQIAADWADKNAATGAGATASTDADIVYSDGAFVTWPEGTATD